MVLVETLKGTAGAALLQAALLPELSQRKFAKQHITDLL